MSANHKQAAKVMRTFLKESGIKALCDMSTSCGSSIIRVCVPSYEEAFTAEQIEKFCASAKDFGLTFVRGTQIDPEHEAGLTGKQQWNFYL